jgi:hypothetical protein
MSARRTPVALVVAAALAAAGTLLAAEVYGKPLKGLSAVSVAAAVSNPAAYSGKTIRVAGVNAGEKGKPALKEGDAVLPILPDGFELPEDLGRVRLAAEGRLRDAPGGVVFVATGIEVRR